MPKFNITAEFSLRTYITPAGYFELDNEFVEDYSDDSYFNEESVSSSGGAMSFTIEAVDEDDARGKAESALNYDLSYRGDDLEWEWEDIEITSVDRVEEPMTLERAILTLQEWLARPGTPAIPAEVMEAIRFILAYLVAQQPVLPPLLATSDVGRHDD